MSGKLISANDVLKYTVLAGEIRNQYMEVVPAYFVREAPAVDAVEVDTVAEMLYRAIGDRCACNVNGNDEWLSEVCELQEQCPHPKDLLGCWKQFVKHYRSEKMDGGEKKNE